MKRSTDRILTTHVGSLARPQPILEALQAKVSGGAFDEKGFETLVQSEVKDIVKKQVETGIDVVSDGELSKDSFYAYARERLGGFEPQARGVRASRPWPKEIAAFQDYYDNYYFAGRAGGRIGSDMTLVTTGPITYIGQAQVQRDIANLKAAAQAAGATEAFMPATVPQGLGINEYYKSEDEFRMALADAMREEYKAIVDAGLVLQVDDPVLTTFYAQDGDRAQQRKSAEAYVDAINHALRGIPEEMVRFHTCYGINEGPRVYDVPLEDIVDLMLRVNAGAYSFEFGNPRHEHEYHVFEKTKLPAGKSLIPGMITHTTNVVEHPEVIAERIINFANIVGRESVIAGADCGFSSQASFKPDVHPKIVWAKFEALSEGARIASKKLWK